MLATDPVRERVEKARTRLISGTLTRGLAQPVMKGTPWFGVLSSKLQIVEDNARCKAMATDGTHLFYNAKWVAAQTDGALCFTWAHEVLHCALRHMFRKPAHISWKEWNICTDLAINGILIALAKQYGWDIPASILHDTKYNDMSAEEIAHARAKEAAQQTPPPQPPQPPDNDDSDSEQEEQDQDDSDETDDTDTDDTDDTQDDDADDGEEDDVGGSPSDEDEQEGDESDDGDGDSDASDTPSPLDDTDDEQGDGEGDGEGDDDNGDDLDDGADGSDGAGSADDEGDDVGDLRPPPKPQSDGSDDNGSDPDESGTHDPVQTEESWARAVDQIESITRKAGAMPAGVSRMIEQARPAETDWRAITRQFVETVAPTRQTWLRPNKRHIARGIYLPYKQRENLPPLLIGIDTSCSITPKNLSDFNEHVQVIWTECKPRALYVVYCDTDVQQVQVFTRQEDDIIELDFRGGGGTEFQPVFDYATQMVESGEWEQPAACIYLTDLECWSAPIEPDYPVLWACVPGTYVAGATWLFGQTVVLS